MGIVNQHLQMTLVVCIFVLATINMLTPNYHYDRIEGDKDNLYNTLRGTKPIGSTDYDGFVKCKLVHGHGWSVVVPDLIYITDNATDFTWFQFYSFVSNQFLKFSDDEIIGTFYVDIAFGHTLRLTISNEGHVTNLQDHSNLFRCRITGSPNLMDFSTGKGQLINGIPYIYLYHHTLPDTKELILKSLNYRGSLWNYQGTKKLENICYAYFTSLDALTKPTDLKMIAMAHNGEMHLVVDVSLEVVPIMVYRENTKNRTATLKQLIDSSIILNNHIWMHTHDFNGTIYYEICSPFIYRVGLKPNSLLPFIGKQIDRVTNTKTTGYIVLGDSTTKIGLLAPLDEEHTTHIFKIEPFHNVDSNLLRFWFANGNKDLYTSKKVEKQKFNRR